MTDATGRPQDQGRPHRRKGSPTAETASLLAEYQAAMRTELRGLLVELRGRLPDPGLLPDPDAKPQRPDLKERAALWDLAVKVARELGTEVDDRAAPADGRAAATPRKRRRPRVDYGPDK